MTHTYTYGQLIVSVTKREYTPLTVMLLPFQLLPSELETLADDYKSNIAVISGLEWNDDLTPWPSEPDKEGLVRFKGFGERFLENLTDTVIPKIERITGHPSSTRTLLGVSLGGLFAVWQMTQSREFDKVASVSGSFWYTNFNDFLRTHSSELYGTEVYLSLGEKEATNSNTIYGDVLKATQDVVQTLENAGIKVELQMTPGGHSSPIYPRIEKALSSLVSMSHREAV